jgi:hypothetical protein
MLCGKFSLHVKLSPVYGYETWSLTLGKGHRLRVFENRVQKIIFGPRREGRRKEWEAREDCILRSFKICTLHQILVR